MIFTRNKLQHAVMRRPWLRSLLVNANMLPLGFIVSFAAFMTFYLLTATVISGDMFKIFAHTALPSIGIVVLQSLGIWFFGNSDRQWAAAVSDVFNPLKNFLENRSGALQQFGVRQTDRINVMPSGIEVCLSYYDPGGDLPQRLIVHFKDTAKSFSLKWQLEKRSFDIDRFDVLQNQDDPSVVIPEEAFQKFMKDVMDELPILLGERPPAQQKSVGKRGVPKAPAAAKTVPTPTLSPQAAANRATPLLAALDDLHALSTKLYNTSLTSTWFHDLARRVLSDSGDIHRVVLENPQNLHALEDHLLPKLLALLKSAAPLCAAGQDDFPDLRTGLEALVDQLSLAATAVKANTASALSLEAHTAATVANLVPDGQLVSSLSRPLMVP